MKTNDKTNSKPSRRTILGAIGTLTGSLIATGSATGDDCPERDPAERGRTGSLMCGELPAEHHEGSNESWYESSITFQNCSSCTRSIDTRVTDGHIHEDKEEEPHESDQTSVLTDRLEGGERKTFWFTGSINNFDLGAADMNVALSQRSVEHAPDVHCYRLADETDDRTDSDDECPEGDPAEGGRTGSLMCGELPAEHHDGGDEPWYESSITFQNCSSCTRQISVGISGGQIHENKDVEPLEDDQSRSLSYHIEGGERKTFWFTGSVGYLDLSEPSDMNVAISQRSIEHAQSSRCYRP